MPAKLTVISGTTLKGAAGQPLGQSITARVTSASGAGVPGVVVSFAVAGNSGTLTRSAAMTTENGTASTTWTLGTAAGIGLDTLRVSTSTLPDQAILVTATVSAGPPEVFRVVSGNEQIATPGVPLPQPLVVSVGDHFGNPNEGIQIHWKVEGGGTLSDTLTTTDSAGTASVKWTPGLQTNHVDASATGVIQVVPFDAPFANTGAVVLTSVSPNPLIEGQSATLTGTGFSATQANDVVVVDGTLATVASASPTSLTITVPTFDCRPSRSVDVRVVVSGDNSNSVSQPLRSTAATVNLAVGQQLILQDPAKFCVQFGNSSVPEAYLVGVQSVTDVVTSMTPVTLSSVSGSNVLASMTPVPLQPDVRFGRRGPSFSPASAPAERWRRQRIAEARIRAKERQYFRPRTDLVGRTRTTQSGLATSPVVAASIVPATVAVGDTLHIHVPDLNQDICRNYVPITAVVRAVGTRGIWLEDTSDPSGGFTVSDFQTLSNLFDNKIYDVDTQYFGTPTDFDGNSHVVIVTTKEVNKVANLLGFVVSTDLVPTTTCAASNDGEFYYGRAPDPTGQFQSPAPYSAAQARLDAQSLIAHEFTHVIQFGHRLTNPNATAFQTPWEAEGQATFAEEVVGDAVTGRSSGQNYGSDVAFNDPQTSSVDWYSDRFVDLAVYYGFQTSTSKVSNAPEQCSWLARASDGNDGPCLSGREVYGVPWSFLRWLSDQFGSAFPGGEQELQQRLIDDNDFGFTTIENVIKVPMDSLLAQWAAMLYVDDRVPGAAPRLTLPSWNLADISAAIVPSARLTPRERSFTTFTDAITVRGASTGYFRISGFGHPPMAIRARDAAGNTLPSNMQLWVVRLQ